MNSNPQKPRTSPRTWREELVVGLTIVFAIPACLVCFFATCYFVSPPDPYLPSDPIRGVTAGFLAMASLIVIFPSSRFANSCRETNSKTKKNCRKIEIGAAQLAGTGAISCFWFSEENQGESAGILAISLPCHFSWRAKATDVEFVRRVLFLSQHKENRMKFLIHGLAAVTIGALSFSNIPHAKADLIDPSFLCDRVQHHGKLEW